MNIKIEIERSATLPAPYARVQELLKDVEGTIRLFPKLRKLTRQADGSHLWELAPMGSKAARIVHEVSFAAKFVVDVKKGLVQWKPVKGQNKNQGNASIEGRWQVQPRGDGTHMSLRVWGELRDVPVPLMFRLVAPAFIQGKFAALVERYFVKLGETLDLSPDALLTSQ